MKFTLDWLKYFIKFKNDMEVETIAEALTNIGFEVESIFKKNLTIAKIIEAKPHPDAEKLQILKVDNGKGEILQIVCGAKNAREGLIGVLAPIGTYLPAIDLTIKKSKIRGIESYGMMCSYEEIGASIDYLKTTACGIIKLPADGIIELPASTPLGDKVPEYCQLDISPVIEVSVTPNLRRYASVDGIAFQLYKYFSIDGKYGRRPTFGYARVPSVGDYKYLEAIGLNVKQNYGLYCTLAYGYPAICFNNDKIKGNLKCQKFYKTGYANKNFIGEDNKHYLLEDTDWVITDDEKIVGLPGLITSAETKFNWENEAILCYINEKSECIFKNYYHKDSPGCNISIYDLAQMAKRLGIKNANTELLEITLPDDSKEAKPEKISYKAIEEYIDSNIPNEDIKDIINFGIYDKDTILKDDCVETTYKKVDLIHEIIRFYGIDKINSQPLPKVENLNKPKPEQAENHQKVFANSIANSSKAKAILATNGFIELMNWSFISEDLANIFADNKYKPVAIKNPISNTKTHMRTSLLPGLLDAIATNLAYGQQNLKFCEVSDIYINSEENGQILHAAAIKQGSMQARNWHNSIRNVNIFDAKQDAFALLEAFNINLKKISINNDTPNYYHPTRSGTIIYANEILGYFGEFHPNILKKCSISTNTALCGFEVNLNNIVQYANNKTKSFKATKLQPIYRDLAFIVDINQPAIELQKIVYKQSELINKVDIFDEYINQDTMSGKKSLALEFSLIPEKTLTSEEINELMQKIINAIEKKTNATLRSA